MTMAIDPIERHLFLEGVFLRYGYDFRQYSEASLNRRLASLLLVEPTGKSLLVLLQDVLKSPERFRKVVSHLTINTTEFFRDPLFFRSLRENVFPLLKTYPSLRVWIAGCSSGQEIISLSILLSEDGLLDRTTIYATDINPQSIKQARDGIYDLTSIQSFARNYAAASGLMTPSDYYTADYSLIRFQERLRENVVLSEHNLATDAAFTEAHLILCRNVLIYFNRSLQDRAFQLFSKSLIPGGFLGLGSKETLKFSQTGSFFQPVDLQQNIYKWKSGSASHSAHGERR